jgi:hypothetical protein
MNRVPEVYGDRNDAEISAFLQEVLNLTGEKRRFPANRVLTFEKSQKIMLSHVRMLSVHGHDFKSSQDSCRAAFSSGMLRSASESEVSP